MSTVIRMNNAFDIGIMAKREPWILRSDGTDETHVWTFYYADGRHMTVSDLMYMLYIVQHDGGLLGSDRQLCVNMGSNQSPYVRPIAAIIGRENHCILLSCDHDIPGEVLKNEEKCKPVGIDKVIMSLQKIKEKYGDVKVWVPLYSSGDEELIQIQYFQVYMGCVCLIPEKIDI